MYAVIKTGGKQYKVSAGENLKVEAITGGRRRGDHAGPGAAGRQRRKREDGYALVAGATVKATVVAHGRGEKVKIFKMRRRKHYRKTRATGRTTPRSRSWHRG